MQLFIRGGKHCHRIELTKMSLRWWNRFQKLPDFWGPRTNAQSVFFSCHFQDKPGRYSEGSWVNLMTIAMSSSRNLFISASRESHVLQKPSHLLKNKKKETRTQIPLSACASIMVLGRLSQEHCCDLDTDAVLQEGCIPCTMLCAWLGFCKHIDDKDKALGKSEGGTGKSELKLICPR